MQISIYAFIIVFVVGGRASDAPTDEPTDVPTDAPVTTTLAPTTTKPFNDCPEGWVYAGPLGCFYFNTNKHKVTSMLRHHSNHFFNYFLRISILNILIREFISQSGLSWIEAQGECEILGGFLAEVKTEGEHEFLKGVTGLLEVRQDVLKYLNGS